MGRAARPRLGGYADPRRTRRQDDADGHLPLRQHGGSRRDAPLGDGRRGARNLGPPGRTAGATLRHGAAGPHTGSRKGAIIMTNQTNENLPVVPDMKLELVPVPVSDVDRAKAFYSEKAGFKLEVDVQPTATMRVI